MSDRIPVVFAVNDFLIGGVQRLYLDLFETLDRNTLELHLLTLMQFPDRKELYDAVPPHVSVHRLAFGSFRDVVSWWKLVKELKRIRPRIVVSSLFFTNTVLRVLKPFFGYRIVAMEHNTYVDKTGLQIFTDRVLAHVSEKIVAVSESVRKFTISQEGIAPEKFVVIRNGINIERIQKAARATDRVALRRGLGVLEEDTLVINVARLTKQKNQSALIEAFAASRPGYKLIILGEGALKGTYEAKIQELGAGKYIRLLGAKEDVVPFYAASDFFVSPSLIEGFGIAHAEALAAGLPVLTTKTAGPDEMIREGENGFFIESTTPEAILEGMEKMASADIAAMHAGAQRSVEAYSIARTAAAFEDLFRAVIAR